MKNLSDKSSAMVQWSELYGRPVSEEEYREICTNLSGFFGLLREWDKEASLKKGKDSAKLP